METNQPNQSIIATVSNEIFKKAVAEHRKKKEDSVRQGPSYPAILIVGPSGTGKSRSILKLPPSQTVIINPEGKALPFKNAGDFDEFHFNNLTTHMDVEYYLDVVSKEPSIKYIVIDSFTKYGELLYNQARSTKQGWDIQNMNNDKIFEFLEKIKKIKDKFVIMTGIDEIVTEATVTGATIRNRRLAVSGKKWEGKIEKEFTLVLFSEVEKQQAGGFKYQFVTNTDGTTSAKSPEGMFNRVIDNDLKFVCDKATEYYKLQ